MANKKKTTAQKKQANPIDDAYKAAAKKRSGKFAKNQPGNKGKVVTTVLCLVLVCAGLLAALAFSGRLDNLLSSTGLEDLIPANSIAQGVTLAGVDVGSMTKEEAIAAVEANAADAYTRNSLVVTVLDQQWELTPGLSGAVLDTEGAVKAAFDCRANEAVDIIPYLQLNAEAIQADIAEFAKFFPTEGLQSGYEIVEGEAGELLQVTIGTDHYDFDADKFYTAVLEALNSGHFQLDYPCKQLNLTAIDLDAIYSQHCTDPVEAMLDPDTLEVTQSSAGYRFELEPAREALAAAEPGDTLEFPFATVEPEVSTELLQSMLFRDVLGTYTAVSSSGYDRDTNLWLACQSINGIILNPGESFSYNEALGERTPEKGYRPAASYLGSETVYTYGGGICQPSSSLYYASLIADIEIVQRECHGYVSSYMPLGMDATVDWNGPDFQIRNNTAFPIRIEAYAEGGSTTVTLIGTDTKDYYVVMDYEVLGVSYPSVKEIEVAPGSGHYDGEVKTSAYTGYTVQSYKYKYSKETDELLSCEEEAYSYYYKRDQEVYKVKQPETEPTEEPTEESTTPPTDSIPSDPVPSDPVPSDPVPSDPVPSDPVPSDPVPSDPVPSDPAPQPPIGEGDGNSQLPGE